MKKKLICLLLCLVFALGCFAGCANKSDEEAAENITDKASTNAMTLVMYLMCDEVPSADQQEAITYAVNKITKAKYKTQLVLKFYTEEDYYSELDNAFAERQAAVDAGKISKVNKTETEAVVEDETIVNDWGVTEIKYPKAESYQVDIFYMGGYDNYTKYKSLKVLADVTQNVTEESKLLQDYIFPQYFDYMKQLSGTINAIPTNSVIGEYTYLLVNKEYAKEFDYNTPNGYASLTSPTCDSFYSFINEVALAYGKEGIMYTDLSQYELASVSKDAATMFWTVDENGNLVYDEFSLLGSTYDTTKGYGDKDSYMEMGSVLSKNAAFIANLEKVKYYESEGYLTADESALADGKVSFACIKGGADIPDIYAENYEAVVVGTPTFTAEDVYRDMFAVTSYSNVKRSMEIVTLLNTDEEFRNLILYGIEKGFEIELDRKVVDANGNPVLDENGVQKKTTITVPANYEKVIYEDPITGHEYTAIRRLNKNYMMSPEKTGNQLLVYGVVNKDNVKEIEFLIKKDYAIIQNNDVVVNPILGFTPGYGKNPYNADTMKLIRETSAEVLVKLNAMDYNTFISENGIAALRTEYDSVIKLVAATGTPDDHSDENYKPFAYGYYKWAKELGIAPEIIGLD